MNKKDFKKNLLTLGLVASLTFNMVGCASNTNNNSNSNASTSISEEMKTYETDDYYLVYLNGNYYLTTRERNKTYINDYSRYHYNYYDANNKDLVGRVVDNAVSNKPNENGRSTQLYDYNHLNGEYGYGKLIPVTAIIPVNRLISSDEFTTIEFNFLYSNSFDLHNTIKNTLVYNKIKIVDYYKIKPSAPLGLGRTATSYYKQENLKKYVCETKDGNTDVILGYKCSYYDGDLGCDYVYDILTGNIVYIGKNRENSYVNIEEYVYENNDNLNDLITKFNNMSDDLKISNTEKTISSEDLFILDITTINSNNEWEYNYLTDNVEHLYFLTNTKERELETNYLIFKDLYNEAEAWVADDLLSLNYADYNKNVVISYLQETKSTPYIKTINTYLVEKGFEDLIKDKYTQEDIENIKNTLYSLSNTKKLEK